MSIIASAKSKAARGSVKEAFKNEAGAIDLASIMVGIIVIGLIGGVIAATVFAVIPWAQDNAAKQQLDSISSAQSAYIGLSTEGGVAAKFGTAADLNSAKLFDGSGLGANVKIGAVGTGSGAHYAAAAKSGSGKWFTINDTKTQPTDAGTTAPTKVVITPASAGPPVVAEVAVTF